MSLQEKKSRLKPAKPKRLDPSNIIFQWDSEGFWVNGDRIWEYILIHSYNTPLVLYIQNSKIFFTFNLSPHPGLTVCQFSIAQEKTLWIMFENSERLRELTGSKENIYPLNPGMRNEMQFFFSVSLP